MSAKPQLHYSESDKAPQTDHENVASGRELRHAATMDPDYIQDLEDELIDDPESPLHANLISKDDLDLHTRITALSHIAGHHPRASAVDPISIPLHGSQRHITLDTDFDNNVYKTRTSRSYSQGDSAAASPLPPSGIFFCVSNVSRKIA